MRIAVYVFKFTEFKFFQHEDTYVWINSFKMIYYGPKNLHLKIPLIMIQYSSVYNTSYRWGNDIKQDIKHDTRENEEVT